MSDEYRPVVGDQIRHPHSSLAKQRLRVTAVGKHYFLAINEDTGEERVFSSVSRWEKVEIPKRYEVEMRVPEVGERYLASHDDLQQGRPVEMYNASPQPFRYPRPVIIREIP